MSAPLTTVNATVTQIYSDFSVDETAGDVVLQKTRYYAGTGNALEEILRAQGIDTVILSGIRTSGVILSTAYRLFDLDYKVYVFSKSHHESCSATMCLLTIDVGTSSPTTPLKLHLIRLASMLRFWRVCFRSFQRTLLLLSRRLRLWEILVLLFIRRRGRKCYYL